jgi:hypothetical protein
MKELYSVPTANRKDLESRLKALESYVYDLKLKMASF